MGTKNGEKLGEPRAWMGHGLARPVYPETKGFTNEHTAGVAVLMVMIFTACISLAVAGVVFVAGLALVLRLFGLI